MGAGQLQSLAEAQTLDSLTSNLGPSGRDHVQGLLARNACHFAPFSWFRWKAFFEQALSLATQAHASGGNQQVVAQTWLMLGYANHFLQDSFAAGHLLNKSLVMQWFVEWAANQSGLAVYDWDSVKNITASAQPLLAGLQLYQPGATGPSNDPQTAEEQPNAATSPQNINRVNATGIQAANGLSQQDAYQAYLAWLDNPVCQVVTAQLHDYLNGRGVQAQATSGPTFLTYGDNTMLEGTTNTGGGTGPGLARAAALATESAIAEVLASGSTTTTSSDIMALFPSHVMDNTGALVTLQQWHAVPSGELYNLAISNESFDSWKTWGTGLGSYAVDLGVISVDQPDVAAFHPSWSNTPTAVGFHTSVRAATCSWSVDGSPWISYFYVPSGSSTVASYRRDSGSAVEVPVPGSVSTTMAPAVAVYSDQLYLACTDPEGEVNVWSTADGENWNGPMTVPGMVATSGPGLCSFEGGLLLAAQVSGGVHFSQFQNGTWSSSPQAIPGAPPGGSPALASLGSTAVIAYNGTGGQLYIGTYTGSVWEGPTQKSGTTKMDVALVAVSSPAPSFVLIYTGTNSSLYWLSSADGTSWSGGSKLSTQASGPPALGVNAISQPSGLECVFAFQGGLFLLESSVSGNQWQWSSTAYELGWMGSLPTSPTLAEYGGLSWLFVPSEDGLLAATSNGSPWTPLEALPGTLPFSDTRACASVHVDDLGNQTLQISCVDNTGAVQVLSYDGKVWSPMPAATGPGAATGATGLVDFGGQATVFYISNDALLWDSFDDSTQQWVHNGAVPGIISPSDVSVATLGDSLFVAYLDGSQRVMVTGWNGETWWPAPKQESHDTGRSVSLAAYEDAVILAFVGTDGYLRATYNTALTATGSGWASDQKFEAAFRAPGLVETALPGHTGQLLAIYPWSAPQYSGLFMRSMVA